MPPEESTQANSEAGESMLLESCRVEELMPKFIKPAPFTHPQNKLNSVHPAPQYTED
jgi:hypothetical protein